MNAILGIDAAWSTRNPSGLALVKQTASGAWECVKLAKSYAEFIECTGLPTERPSGLPPIHEALQAAERLCGEPVRLVAADLPLATHIITGRRQADNQISRIFGRCKCGTHTFNETVHDYISQRCRLAFEAIGFQFATSVSQVRHRTLIEVYPHPALLALMKVAERVPYKWSKRSKYWPIDTPEIRRNRILQQLQLILKALSRVIEGIPLKIEENGIKAIEDKLDALICAWVGILTLEGKTTPIGDHKSAIWVPTELIRAMSLADLLAGPAASPEFGEGIEDLPVQEREFFTT